MDENKLNVLEKKIKSINDLTKQENTLTPEIKKRTYHKITEILGQLGNLSNLVKIDDEIGEETLKSHKKYDLLKNRCHRIIEKINK